MVSAAFAACRIPLSDPEWHNIFHSERRFDFHSKLYQCTLIQRIKPAITWLLRVFLTSRKDVLSVSRKRVAADCSLYLSLLISSTKEHLRRQTRCRLENIITALLLLASLFV